MNASMLAPALLLFSMSAAANELCAAKIQEKDLHSIYVELMQPVQELSHGTNNPADEFLVSNLWYLLVEVTDLIAMGGETVLPMRDKLATDPQFVDQTAGGYFRKLRQIVDDVAGEIGKHQSGIKTPAAAASMEKARQGLVKVQAVLKDCT